MLTRKIQELPKYIYPTDEWRLVEKEFYSRLLPQMETLFATANGFLGIRGCHEEGTPVHESATLINSFHETWPITYGEEAFGFARTGQTIVNAPDGYLIRLYVDDGPMDISKANLIHYERTLNMQTGTLDREVVWEKLSGKQIQVRSRRLVSFVHRHEVAMEYEITLLNDDAPVVISSELVYKPSQQMSARDPRGTRAFKERVLLDEGHYARDERVIQSYITRNSRMTLACGMEHVLETDCVYSTTVSSDEDRGRALYSIEGKKGVPIRLIKFLTYHVSRSSAAEELRERAERALDRVKDKGFDTLVQIQWEYLNEFWERSDVEVTGDRAVQQVLRFNLFHIYQASARAESVGIPVKGLTGQGYEGQYFWDAEIYVLPFLVYTSPRIARNHLLFRYRMLDKARQRARELNQRGALFPWRTINGEEASAYYAAGTAQYHINADIIYALKKYVDVTGDTGFLYKEGAEMLVETARFWADLGFYSPAKGGKFCINGVTGPDEYNTVVNNNAFTNLMARENLAYAVSTVEYLRDNRPDEFGALAYATELQNGELEEWKEAAAKMYIPYDKKSGIHLQDDGFLNKEPWDFAGTPPDKYPLLLHFHPLVIYRHQVLKQADIVLAMYLLGHEFSLEQKKRNFEYYDPLTTGDSSLSVSIQSIAARELGMGDKARDYTRYALLMDMADVASNVQDGCHIASMGGTWMAVVYGVAGMRDYNGKITFDPKLRKPIRGLWFDLQIRGQQLLVEMNSDSETATYTLKEGTKLTIWHKGEKLQLRPGEGISRKFKPL
jgi:alpha,alpha-trehalose phosphorylase